ncbi:At2g23090 like protein [Xylariaceae sp. FL1019]|nr:At2g23090 like protein [Xylariaceae sp. FL1019]
MGNGAKAQNTRDRKKDTSKGGKSQLKANKEAIQIKCKCSQTWSLTAREPELQRHLDDKHNGQKFDRDFFVNGNLIKG